MDEKGTQIDSNNHIRLTSVRPGKTCRLVRVSKSGGRGRGRHQHHGRQRHRGFFGRFSKQTEHEEHKEIEWHHRGERRITRRLLDLGLTKGCTFKVVQGSGRGPILVEVRGTRIALGHGLASKILIEVLEEHA